MTGVGPARKYPTWVWNPLSGGAYVNSHGGKRSMPSSWVIAGYILLSILYEFIKTAYEEVPDEEEGIPPYGLATRLVMRWKNWFNEARKGRTRL